MRNAFLISARTTNLFVLKCSAKLSISHVKLTPGIATWLRETELQVLNEQLNTE